MKSLPKLGSECIDDYTIKQLLVPVRPCHEIRTSWRQHELSKFVRGGLFVLKTKFYFVLGNCGAECSVDA
jgi:hypothetical protein